MNIINQEDYLCLVLIELSNFIKTGNPHFSKTVISLDFKQGVRLNQNFYK